MESRKIDWNKVDTETLKNYLENTPTQIESKILVALYNTYTRLLKLETKQPLDNFEDEVYTINGKRINNKERIELELERIKNKNLTNKEYKDWINTKLNYLNGLIEENEIDNSNIELYIKKEIVRMQALLGLNITFFKAAKEAFLEENRNLKHIESIEYIEIPENKLEKRK